MRRNGVADLHNPIAATDPGAAGTTANLDD
jgi:hypothetical protein